MRGKNLIITFIWTFMLATILILSLEGFGLTFMGYLILFFTALMSTAAIEFLIPETESEIELRREIQNLQWKLDEYIGKVDQMN